MNKLVSYETLVKVEAELSDKIELYSEKMHEVSESTELPSAKIQRMVRLLNEFNADILNLNEELS